MTCLRFLVDMCVSERVVAWLRDEGHDALHLSEIDLETADDRKVFAFAAESQRILVTFDVTFDLDFGEILAAGGARNSVVVFRLAKVGTSDDHRQARQTTGRPCPRAATGCHHHRRAQPQSHSHTADHAAGGPSPGGVVTGDELSPQRRQQILRTEVSAT